MLVKFENLEIENPQFIYGGNGRDHHDNNGIPPDENDRSKSSL